MAFYSCLEAMDTELPLCGDSLRPALEASISETYHPSVHSSLFNIDALFSEPLPDCSNLVRFPSLPESFHWEGSLPAQHEQQQQPQQLHFSSLLGSSEQIACTELTAVGGPDDHGRGYGQPIVVKQKKACIKNAALAEILRRKKISKCFSKLETLLPQDGIPRFDRCSLIDATICYIQSLQKTISEASQQEKEERASGGDRAVENVAVAPAKEACKVADSTIAATGQASTELHEKGVFSISMIGPEHACINVITSHTDPVLFSTMISVLHHQHHLHVLSASFTRNADEVFLTFYAKISSASGDYNHQCLKDNISSVLASLSKA